MPAPAGANAAQVRQSLLELLDPVVAEHGYELEDVNVSSAGRKSMVRVIVDADGGVDLDAVATVSRAVAEALDDDLGSVGDHSPGSGVLSRALAGSYVLEVSSPGVDRPLTEPRHWRRAIGRLVAAEVSGRPVTGRVLRVDDHRVALEVKGREQSVPFTDLGRGKVQVEFNRKSSEKDEGE